ncbi:hypothetical protein [Chitinimonas sp. BJB300]|uniref:hypothetical protein n=1 Tax=Chitinimonas sp. BJB300 TaxID=1559339 RepID=UPI0013047A54|nr:hypothetical protein [Chitinimonas sp. BJB300]
MKCLQGLFQKTTKSSTALQTLSALELAAVYGGSSVDAPTPPQANNDVPPPKPTTGVGG